MNIDAVVSFFLSLVKAKYTGKLHITLDKGIIVDTVEEKKIDTAPFRTG